MLISPMIVDTCKWPMFQHKITKQAHSVLGKATFVKLRLSIPRHFQMNDDDNSSAYTTLKPSTKQKALMEDKVLMKQHSSKQTALMEDRILTKQNSTKQNSTKQIALMEDRISSWNMNGSVPILTFTGRGEYLSQIVNEFMLQANRNIP